MKKRSIGALAYKNIQNNKGRYFKQAAMVMVLTWTMLLGLIIIVSISSGLERLRDRMGADLMLVPLGYERSAEGILIKGEPKYFYFEQDIMTQLENADIEGIERLSSQFYLTSSNQGCCDIPVQFIGLDKDSDFTIKPWIKTLYVNEKDYLNDGYIVVGSSIDVPQDGKIRFYDQYFTVAAKLDQTGSGLDNAVFLNRTTTKTLYEAALSKGFNFMDGCDPLKTVSSVFITVKDGTDVKRVSQQIRSHIDGVQVIATDGMIGSTQQGLEGFISLMYILIGILIVLSFVILSLSFKLQVTERKDDYKLMRTIGVTKGEIRKLVLSQAFILSIIGSILGLVLATVSIFPFYTAINAAVSIPFLIPSGIKLALLYLVTGLIGIIIGPLGALGSAIRISGGLEER